MENAALNGVDINKRLTTIWHVFNDLAEGKIIADLFIINSSAGTE